MQITTTIIKVVIQKKFLLPVEVSMAYYYIDTTKYIVNNVKVNFNLSNSECYNQIENAKYPTLNTIFLMHATLFDM